MTKQGFVEFSLEKEDTIDKMLKLFDYNNWVFRWDDLKDIIIKNNISAKHIINILDILKDLKIKVKQDKFDFLRFACKMLNKGFNENHIVSQYIHLLDQKK